VHRRAKNSFIEKCIQFKLGIGILNNSIWALESKTFTISLLLLLLSSQHYY